MPGFRESPSRHIVDVCRILSQASQITEEAHRKEGLSSFYIRILGTTNERLDNDVICG